MNIIDLPNDIHYNIINNIHDNNIIIHLKNTCKTFKTLFNKEIKLAKVDLFKLSIIFKFHKYDLKKHEMICRKFSRFKDEFYNGFIQFNRKINESIFETTTLVYIKIYIDDFKDFNIKFDNYLKNYNIDKEIQKNKKYNKENLEITLSIYYGENFFQYIHEDNLNDNRKNLIIDSKTNLKTINIFNRNEFKNLEYYQWDNLDKMLNIKYSTYIILFTFNSTYIVMSKNIFINNINRLINNYIYKLKVIRKSIIDITNNFNLNEFNQLNQSHDILRTELSNLLDIRLKFNLKNKVI